MIFWLPVIILRPFFYGRKALWLDVLLLLVGAGCILIAAPDFEVEASWQHLPLYALLGMLVFVGSVGVTTLYPMQYLRKTIQSIRRPEMHAHTQAAWGAVKTAVAEEVVWRVVLQTVLSIAVGMPVSVLIIAVTFTLLHRQRTSGLTIQLLEMLVFSLLLGWLFALTRDVMAIIVIHAIRNYFIGIRGVSNEAR